MDSRPKLKVMYAVIRGSCSVLKQLKRTTAGEKDETPRSRRQHGAVAAADVETLPEYAEPASRLSLPDIYHAGTGL